MFLSGGRIERAILKHKPMYALLVVEGKEEGVVSAPYVLLQPLLEEFGDVFPIDLPPNLSPMRGIEHHIDLVTRAPLPNRVVYKCSPMEAKKLQGQVDKLITR